MRRVSPTVAVAWLATFAAIVLVQAETRSAASVPAICHVIPIPIAANRVAIPGAGIGFMSPDAAEHTVTVSALQNLQSCAMALAQDLDKADAALKAQKGRLDSVEARLNALEGKAPAPDDEPDPAPPSPSAEGGLARRVAALEGEVTALKTQLARLKAPPESRVGQQVRAPFTVVDDRDNVLLHVGDGTPRLPDGVVISRLGGDAVNAPGLTVRNNGGVVAQLGATYNESGGLVLARPGDGGVRIVLDASQSKIAIADGKGAVLALLVDDEAMGPTVAVLSPAGETLAGLSRNPGGGRVFANLSNSEPAFRGGSVGGTGDACIWAKRGPVCLNGILPLR